MIKLSKENINTIKKIFKKFITLPEDEQSDFYLEELADAVKCYENITEVNTDEIINKLTTNTLDNIYYFPFVMNDYTAEDFRELHFPESEIRLYRKLYNK